MEFFSWEFIGTYAGATAVTALITQFVKDIPFLKKIPTQIVSWVIAAVLLVLTTIFTGEVTAKVIILDILNAVLVSLCSNGGYDAVKRLMSGDFQTKE